MTVVYEECPQCGYDILEIDGRSHDMPDIIFCIACGWTNEDDNMPYDAVTPREVSDNRDG